MKRTVWALWAFLVAASQATAQQRTITGKVTSEQNLPLIDLNTMSKRLYEAWGPEKSKLAFAPGDNTHHNDYGSYELAKCIVEGIRQNKLELARFLTEAVSDFDPSHPDPIESFHLPHEPQPTTQPEGN